MSAGSPRRQIGLYLTLTALFSSVFYAFIIATGRAHGGRGAYATGLMWCPALAAIISCRLNGIALRTLGWGWGKWRWQWLAYTIPLGYATVAYTVVWRAGLGGFPDPEFVTWVRTSFAWAGVSDWLAVAGAFAFIATTGMAASMGHALGEEIGWRGFLSPRMTQVFGFTSGAALTGMIWTTWHLPILLFADYNGGTPWWFGMSCFTVMVGSMSVIMAWLRRASGSLWTGAIFHASHNLFVQSFFTPATSARGSATPYAIDEFGIALPAVSLLLAIAIVIILQRQKPQQRGKPLLMQSGAANSGG
jgi:membrane protease YdiL (CAAX protease family)